MDMRQLSIETNVTMMTRDIHDKANAIFIILNKFSIPFPS